MKGPALATMQALAQNWATEYDWRECEAHLESLPHFITVMAEVTEDEATLGDFGTDG